MYPDFVFPACWQSDTLQGRISGVGFGQKCCLPRYIECCHYPIIQGIRKVELGSCLMGHLMYVKYEECYEVLKLEYILSSNDCYHMVMFTMNPTCAAHALPLKGW